MCIRDRVGGVCRELCVDGNYFKVRGSNWKSSKCGRSQAVVKFSLKFKQRVYVVSNTFRFSEAAGPDHIYYFDGQSSNASFEVVGNNYDILNAVESYLIGVIEWCDNVSNSTVVFNERLPVMSNRSILPSIGTKGNGMVSCVQSGAVFRYVQGEERWVGEYFGAKPPKKMAVKGDRVVSTDPEKEQTTGWMYDGMNWVSNTTFR